MAELPIDRPLPVPESDDLGRYLEDTITIDWQTPSVADCARRLLADVPARASGSPSEAAEARLDRLFRFVRDEIFHTFDLPDSSSSDPSRIRRSAVPRSSSAAAGAPPGFVERGIACRASEVLALGHGLCFAKSHLLAALLRFAGHPTGFCYARLVDDDRPGRFVLHGFVACHWPATGSWIPLDPRGDRGPSGEPGAIASECRLEAPFSLAYVPDPARGESLLPFVYKRPSRRVVDFLERVPDRAALRQRIPDAID